MRQSAPPVGGRADAGFVIGDRYARFVGGATGAASAPGDEFLRRASTDDGVNDKFFMDLSESPSEVMSNQLATR